MSRKEILKKVKSERARQDDIWGNDFDSLNTSNDWVSYITRYAGKAVTNPWDPNRFSENMIKVAAIAVAAIEQLEKTEGNLPPRHYDSEEFDYEENDNSEDEELLFRIMKAAQSRENPQRTIVIPSSLTKTEVSEILELFAECKRAMK